MALADYRLCDVCDHKVFYDANLNYERTRESPFYKLDYLGDWAVICEDCAKTYKCVVIKRDAAISANGEAQRGGEGA